MSQPSLNMLFLRSRPNLLFKELLICCTNKIDEISRFALSKNLQWKMQTCGPPSTLSKEKNQIVTHHSSIHVMPCGSMQELENNSNDSKKGHRKSVFTCKFCNVAVSEYVRNDFLHRISTKKIFHTQDNPQAP